MIIIRICVYSDVHWCQNSSIVRSKGEQYSTRLENLIMSVNWVEQLAWNTGCECVICCGDFFDAPNLNAMEVSALQEIKWAPMSHVFLMGNHETNLSSLEYSTLDLFKLCPNSCVINSPQQYFIDNTTVEFCFLPYVLERDRKSIQEYFGSKNCNRVIFSHNDLKDVQYGNFLSTEGFEIPDISNSCNLYFNGHIHHCCTVTDKVINVGNLTGQNFTEDATKYQHCAIVLDTETLEYKFYQNLYALKFYKIDATDCITEEELINKLSVLSVTGAVLTLHINSSMSTFAKQYLNELKQRNELEEYRLIIRYTSEETKLDTAVNVSSVDHLKQFETYVFSELGTSNIIKEELQQIMR